MLLLHQTPITLYILTCCILLVLAYTLRISEDLWFTKIKREVHCNSYFVTVQKKERLDSVNNRDHTDMHARSETTSFQVAELQHPPAQPAHIA